MTRLRLLVMANAAMAGVLCASAQETLKMTLAQLFDTAEQHNASIQTFRSAITEADDDIEVARAQRRPDLDATAAVSYMGNVKIWDRPLKNKFTAATPHFGNNFAIMARQTVYSGGAITSGIRLAELGREMTTVEAEANRQRVRFMLTGHFLQLHNLRNQQEVFNQNITLAETLISHMRRRAEQGVALENDITRHELQLEQLRLGLAKVEDAQRIINHQITTTLGIDTTITILPQQEFEADLPPQEGEDAWQQIAMANNTSLQKAAIGTRIAQQQVRLERAQRLPKVALVAEDHFDGPVTFEIPTLDKNINYWYVGVGVSYDVASLWKNNKRISKARTAVTRSQQLQREANEGIENAIQEAYTNYLTAFSELSTQQKSVELAVQNYKIIKNRYENGLALITDMTDAANVKLDAELALVSARINVIYDYYQLRFLSNTL